MRSMLYLLAILTVLIILPSCKKDVSSEYNSQCALCGRSYHFETKSGVTVQDEIIENDLSKWLLNYRPAQCNHAWVPVSGWSSTNNIAWDGISHMNSCLEYIKKIHTEIGDKETKKLLDRYYSIVKMQFEKHETQDTLILRANPEAGEILMDFIEELKSKINQIDNKPEKL